MIPTSVRRLLAISLSAAVASCAQPPAKVLTSPKETVDSQPVCLPSENVQFAITHFMKAVQELGIKETIQLQQTKDTSQCPQNARSFSLRLEFDPAVTSRVQASSSVEKLRATLERKLREGSD